MKFEFLRKVLFSSGAADPYRSFSRTRSRKSTVGSTRENFPLLQHEEEGREKKRDLGAKKRKVCFIFEQKKKKSLPSSQFNHFLHFFVTQDLERLQLFYGFSVPLLSL